MADDPALTDDVSTHEKALLAKLLEKGGHAGNVTLNESSVSLQTSIGAFGIALWILVNWSLAAGRVAALA